MLTLPVRTRRKKQPYLAIRSQSTRRNLRRQAVLFFSELRDFMVARGVADTGPAFMRYFSIGDDGAVDVEFGYFTTRLHAGGGPVRSGTLPSGVFLSTEWTGPYENIGEVNAMLLGWARHCGVELDATAANGGTVYGCRLEIFHVTPRHTDDPGRLRSEIAVMMRPAVAEAVVPPQMVQPGAGSAPSFSHLPMGNWRNE